MTGPGSNHTFAGFPRETIDFLCELRNNNHKEWFHRHRKDYDRWYVAPAKAFVVSAGQCLRAFQPSIVAEPRVLGSIFRINRDVRFTKDKRPYKDYLDFWFWEGERKTAVSGFFVRVSPDFVGIGVGCHGFARDALDVFRRAISSAEDAAVLMRTASALEREGYEIGGRHYTRVPSGYDAGIPAARFLLHKALFVHHDEPVSLATESGLLDVCAFHWQTLAPLHRWIESAVGRQPAAIGR